MQTSIRLAVRCAVELCAIMCNENHNTLASSADSLLSEKGIVGVSIDDVKNEIEHNLAARLFSDYKNTPERIKNVNFIKELLRKLWLADIIANNPTMSVENLHKEVTKKYHEEKNFEPDLTAKKFLLFEILNFHLNANKAIAETSQQYVKLSGAFSDCYSVFAEVFDKLNGSSLSYMNDIYNKETGGEKLCFVDETRHAKNTVFEGSPNMGGLQGNLPFSTDQARYPRPAQGEGSSLRDMVEVLEKEKHNLELKVAFAKKDAIREIIYSLTDYSWGAPLSELYLLCRNKDTPEKVKGTIKNLFMALGSTNIRLVKEKQVGTTIILNEENQKAFDPYKNEELFLEDQATIYYPGYRFDREIMVRPVVRKKNKEQEAE